MKIVFRFIFILILSYSIYLFKWTYFNDNRYPLPILSNCMSADIDIDNRINKFGFVPPIFSCLIKNNITNGLITQDEPKITELSKLYSISHFCKQEIDVDKDICYQIYRNVFDWSIDNLPEGFYSQLAEERFNAIWDEKIEESSKQESSYNNPFNYLYFSENKSWCFIARTKICLNQQLEIFSINGLSVDFTHKDRIKNMIDATFSTQKPCLFESDSFVFEPAPYLFDFKTYSIYFSNKKLVHLVDIDNGCISISVNPDFTFNSLSKYIKLEEI